MSQYGTARFDALLGQARTHTTELKANVQELLIIGCFHAFKDGNVVPLNTVLDMATNGKAVSVERITRWVELHAAIAYIKKGQFALNKKVRDATVVTDEESFADVEKHLRTVAWYDSKKKDVAKSVFDIEGFLENTLKALDRHANDPNTETPAAMFDEARAAIRQAKGRIAIMSIQTTNEIADLIHGQGGEPAPAGEELLAAVVTATEQAN